LKEVLIIIGKGFGEVYGELLFKLAELARHSVEKMSESPRGVTWTWDTIKGFGQAKVLRASFIFLFLVPIFANLLSNLPEEITVPLFDKTLAIPLLLPFSWFLLFISSLFASVGNVIYSAFCPTLIKEFKDYQSFEESKRDGTYLLAFVKELSFKEDVEILPHLEALNNLYNRIPIDIRKVSEQIMDTRKLTPQGFYFVRDSVNLKQPLLRLVASVSYFISFVCLGIIAVQNVLYVLRYFL